MGETQKAIRKEIKEAYDSVLKELTEDEKSLSKEEKKQLRDFLTTFDGAKIHSFIPIFIKNKISDIISKREVLDENI